MCYVLQCKHGPMSLHVHRAARKRRTLPTRGAATWNLLLFMLWAPVRWVTRTTFADGGVGAEAAGRLLELVVRIFDDGR